MLRDGGGGGGGGNDEEKQGNAWPETMNTRTPPHLQMHACQLLQGIFRARGKGADERKQYEVSKSQEGCKHLSRPFSFVIVSPKKLKVTLRTLVCVRPPSADARYQGARW